ncbi:MAG: hypothetical protein ACT4PZ_10305 [Panacagrimonas sp.]
MNRLTLCFIILIAGASLLPQARADEGRRNDLGSFGASIGTNGIGVDYAYAINRYFDVRAGYDFGSLNRNEEEEGIEYDGELKFSAGRLLLDYKPFGGGFRISGGLYTGGPELELEGTGEDDFELGERSYNVAADVIGGIDFGSAAPYLGLGWGGTANGSGFGVSFDLGVIFTGSPEVTLSVPSGSACDAEANPGCDPVADGFDVNEGSADALEFQSAVEAERLELEDGTGDATFWPVIRLGLHYRF